MLSNGIRETVAATSTGIRNGFYSHKNSNDMKQIKKIVLKDATKLTSREMKQIRGGHEPKPSPVCSTACPDGSVGTYNCSTKYGSDSICTSSANGYVNCFFQYYGSNIKEYSCPETE